ncbi:hypothetical protein AX774_g6593 [Zancudomyces culisetae]|uniref:Uncharacterized protein n=1 Tax=Zancudomyces culisetae TaxID=1213189 RepID=A0A1R1PGA6_ZANCU|nr:hypothetical protein AX774_g6593 [Zancudomyces culisetae]|eukprot:OMH79977.1 hypothetical protein AX774_g6593 [Zancudomyces culisetae]
MRLLVVSALLAATQLVSADGRGSNGNRNGSNNGNHGRHGSNNGNHNGRHGGHRGRGGHGRGFYPGYYDFPYSPGAVFIGGRYWSWNATPPVAFINTLSFRPSVYDGQRFEFLYTTLATFRTRWDGDIVFRRRWNRDISFRRSWYRNYKIY